ncbi:hypothetical protein B0H19DRAFT_1070146 [Mycena capillaripes]|nr:hypothetical protein B0H19DRAFT_1070146 [Mycena capillaripes]
MFVCPSSSGIAGNGGKKFVDRMSETCRLEAAVGNLWRRVVATWSSGGRSPLPVTPPSQDTTPQATGDLVPLPVPGIPSCSFEQIGLGNQLFNVLGVFHAYMIC